MIQQAQNYWTLWLDDDFVEFSCKNGGWFVSFFEEKLEVSGNVFEYVVVGSLRVCPGKKQSDCESDAGR